ncbi:hypothetical protein CAJAP_01050 [Camponotus japonicus]
MQYIRLIGKEILDQAHITRNHENQASLAVCKLKAKKWWILTGTSIQNETLDLYSILKFFKCSPFDERRRKRYQDR